MKARSLIVSTLILGSVAFAATTPSNQQPAPKEGQADYQNVRPKMQELLANLTDLAKIFFQDKEPSSPKAKAAVSMHLKEMSRLIKKVGHEPKMGAQGFKISRQTLESHINDMEKVYATGNYNYARWMFQATMGLCMNCHTQMPGSSRPHMFDIGDTFSSKFMQAEFYFSTREFDRAEAMYTELIAGYPKSGIKNDELEVAFERKVAYFARVKQDPSGAVTSLLKDLKNPKIPEHIRKNVEAWTGLFREWERQPKFDVATATDAELKETVEKLLKPELWDKVVQASNPRVVTYLRVSGMLYEYLGKHPDTKLTPQILYWLAICDRRLNNDFFYSLANAYLRECIFQFPKADVAKNCFREYEDEMVISYSGSGGTHLPSEVQKELGDMRKLIGVKK